MATDPNLERWGRRLAERRSRTRPDGTPKTSDADATMTQADCAALMDPPVRQSTVARWEAGTFEPRRHYRQQLAALYRTSVETLFDPPGQAAA